MGAKNREPVNKTEDQATGGGMSDELVALLRQRVAMGYYDQPHVVDAVARAIARPGMA